MITNLDKNKISDKIPLAYVVFPVFLYIQKQEIRLTEPTS
jgi:hypothetical protein